MKRRVAVFIVCCVTQVAAGDGAGLVILKETGRSRNGFPVLALREDSSKATAGLSRGFSAKMLRLYACQQSRLKNVGESQGPLEPAYVLLSGNQGGFPRFGFYLGEQDKRAAAFVDLIESGDIHSRFGAHDQIFPHELAHIILRRLAGASPRGGANQVHAIGLRTDPYIAFDEGFAEHMQIMAIEDEDAEPSTRALASDRALRQMASDRLAAYRRAQWSVVSGQWSVADLELAAGPVLHA